MKLQKSLVFFMSLLMCPGLSSQNKLQRTFGDSSSQIAFSARQTADKGFLLSGYTNGNNMQTDFLLVKTDSAFHVQWSKSYGGNTYDEAYSVQQTTDLGYVAAGYTRSFGSQYYDALLLKTDPNGDTSWTKIYGGPSSDYANAIIQAADGGYVFAGFTTDTTLIPALGNLWLVKTDAAGNISWQKEIGPGNQFTDAYGICQTTDKGYAITGYTNGFADINGDAFLMKTDSVGNVQFVKTYGYKGPDWAYTVLQTNDGGYILAGTISTDSTGNDLDVLVIKTDANGDTLWTRSWGAAGDDYGQRLCLAKNGGYTVSGYSNSFGAGFYDALLIGLGPVGDTLFCNLFGGPLDDEANDVIAMPAGGYALAGQTYSFGKGIYDFYWVVSDSSGNSSCHQTNAGFQNRRFGFSVQTVTVQTANAAMNSRNVSPQVFAGIQVSDACLPNDIKLYKAEKKLQLWPNPSAGNFTIDAEGVEQAGSLEIYSLFGECIYAAKVSLPHVINSTFPDGIYLVRFTTDGTTWCERVLINRE